MRTATRPCIVKRDTTIAMNRVKNDDIIRFSDAGKDLKEFDYAFFSKKYVDEHDLSQEDIIKDADKEGVIQIERNKK